MKKRNYTENGHGRVKKGWENQPFPRQELKPTLSAGYPQKLAFFLSHAGIEERVQAKLSDHILNLEEILGKHLFQTATIETIAQARLTFLVYARSSGLARTLAESLHLQTTLAGNKRETASKLISWYVQQESVHLDYLRPFTVLEILSLEGKSEEEYIRTSQVLGLNRAAQEAVLSGKASIYDLLQIQPELFFIIPLIQN